MKELCATGNSLQRQDLPQRQKPCPSEARPTIQTSPTGKSPALHTQALSYRDKTSCFTDTRPPALQGQDLLAYRGKTSPRGARTALQALELPYRGKTSTKPERPALQTKDLQRPALQTKELPYRGKTGPTGAGPALQTESTGQNKYPAFIMHPRRGPGPGQWMRLPLTPSKALETMSICLLFP